MAVVRKSQKDGASRKSRQGKNHKLQTRREKVATKSKRNRYLVKFPRSSYLTACPLMRWYFNQKMRDNCLSLQKGKRPTGSGPIHWKTPLQGDNRKRSARVANRKRSARGANRKKPVRVATRKKAARAESRKASVRGGKDKKAHPDQCTCRPDAMQAALREVAKKKRAKWVVTGMKKRRRGSNKDKRKTAARDEGEGCSSSLDPGAQDLGASGTMPLPTANELQEVAS